MGDVADILRVELTSTPPLEVPKSQIKPKKKPKGVSREVYSLMCADADSAAAVQSMNKSEIVSATGRKFNINPAFKCRTWEWTGFHNSARTDGVRFKHWMRHPIVVDEYPFVRFNKPVYVVSFTLEQYEKFLIEPGWNLEETEMLVKLCRQFDCRWPIIADRWPFSPRNSIDLKERYFKIAKTLVKNLSEEQMLGGKPVDARMAKVTADARTALKTFVYDPEHERSRFEQFDIQFKRSPEDEAEEIVYQKELSRVDADLKKLRGDKKRIEEKRKAEKRKRIQSTVTPKRVKGVAEIRVDDLEKACNSIAHVYPDPMPSVIKRSDRCLPLKLPFVAPVVPQVVTPGVAPVTVQTIEVSPPVGTNQSKSLASLLKRGPDSFMCTEQNCDAYLSFRQDAIRLVVYENEIKILKSELKALRKSGIV